jgi:protoporphyrinogen oxidase
VSTTGVTAGPPPSEATGTRGPVVILGAGPAGLTAGYQLAKRGWPVRVLEADPTYVGGLSRTARYKGYHFDVGGHRFFSKSRVVEDLWTEILPDDMLVRPRSSRIYYNGRFFSYPLRAAEALVKLGVVEATRCVLSYLHARAFPVRHPRSFEDWVSNQFGRRLFTIFFKTYTEKVWGMSCGEISADWAAQRIKGLSLGAAILDALLPRRSVGDRRDVIKTLIDTFRYPRRGPGMLWEECARKIRALGGEVDLGRRAVGLELDPASGSWSVRHAGADGSVEKIAARHVISSASLREVVLGLRPPVSEETRRAAEALRYRDFLTVMLILEDTGALTDNWVYIHDPSVKVGRIQNFKSWSPEMVPDPKMACYGLEYFCFEGDHLWESSDQDLVEMAKGELEQVGLARGRDVVDGCVVRMPKAYPVYDEGYLRRCGAIREELEARFPTLHVVGRNGMHKYDNQDHAMMTALLTAENIVAGRRVYDVWRVNQDAEYIEEGPAGAESSVSGLRAVPTPRQPTP